MKRAFLLAALVVGILAIPSSPAFAISDCSYVTGGTPVGPAVTVYTDGGRTSDSVVGACADTNLAPVDGGYVEVGSGAPGTYAVIDGSDANSVTGQDDGYAGLSSYESGANNSNCPPPDAPGNTGTNSGGCFGFDPSVPVVGGTYAPVPLIACGNSSGNDWAGDGSQGAHQRDGCSIP